MSYWEDYRKAVNWNVKILDQAADENYQSEPSIPTSISYSKTCWCKPCGVGMIGEVMNGANEPLEVVYTCVRCKKMVLSVEGLMDEILEVGEDV